MANPLYASSGRLHGHYVYALQCSDADRFLIKIGMTVNPVERLDQIRTSCPHVPELMAIMHMISREDAIAAESMFHSLLKAFQIHGEWFAFAKTDKQSFNAATARVKAQFGRKSWPLKWTKIIVPPLVADKTRRAAFFRKKWRGGSLSFRDAVRAGLKTLR